jgi:phosphate transport system substrate-binding protein
VLSALPAAAATNFAPSISLLLDDDAALALTAGLKQYNAPPRFAGKVTIVGGGTSSIHINRWTAEFATLFPDIDLETHGGGSSGGFNGLIDSKVDIVHMIRSLGTNEVARFKAKFGYDPAQIIVAQGAEGIYVNKNNPISGLTLAQLDAIYSRDAKRGGGRPELWSDLGVAGPLASEPIVRVSLSQVHSGYLFFQNFIMQGAEYRFDVHFESVPTSLVQAAGAGRRRHRLCQPRSGHQANSLRPSPSG